MQKFEPIDYDCGHRSKPDGFAAGYAIDRNNRTLCYPCADEQQRAERDRSWVMSGYLSNSSPDRVTTWTGGTLARVTSLRHGSAGFGGKSIHIDAVDEKGGQWWGWRSDVGWSDVITLHRRKATPPAGERESQEAAS